MSLRASEVVASVRATLDYPPFDRLKPQILLLKMREKVDHYFNRMNLTDRNWFLDNLTLTVDSASDEYLISTSQWGRPILCETQDLSDPQHIRREVPIIDLQDRRLLYEGTQSASQASTSLLKHTATSFTFFRKPDGSIRTKLTPQPSDTADYVFWYEPNRPIPILLASNLTFLEQFNNLLVVDLSLSCLPYCNYDAIIYDSSNQSYRRRTKADVLRESLGRDFQLYLQTFEEYIQNDTQQKTERKQLWGESPPTGGEWGW